MLTHFSYHFHSMSDHILKNIPVLFLKSLGKEALSKGYIHLFVNLHMRLFLLQKCLTNVVCGPNHSAFFIYTIVTPISWLKIYLESLTISTSILVDLWCSQTVITVPFISHRPPPWLLGSLSVFILLLTKIYSDLHQDLLLFPPLMYTAVIEGYPTQVYCDPLANSKHGPIFTSILKGKYKYPYRVNQETNFGQIDLQFNYGKNLEIIEFQKFG